MIAIISLWVLCGYYYFLISFGWLLIFPRGPVPLSLVGFAWLLIFFVRSFCLEECDGGNV